MLWIGIAIVIGTFWLIYKNYEARLVLFLSGILMTVVGVFVAGSSVGFGQAIDAFVKQLTNPGLVPTYTTVMDGLRVRYELHQVFRPLSQCPGTAFSQSSHACNSWSRHHHVVFEHCSPICCRYRCSCRRSSYSCFNCSWRSSGHGRSCRFPRYVGIGCQSRLNV